MYKNPLNEDWSFFLGRKLTQLCIGEYDIQLHFQENVTISIQGEDPAEAFRHKAALSSTSAVRGMPGGAVTLVSLLGASVQKVVAESNLVLALYFSNNEDLRIFDSSDSCESFTINGPKGLIVV